MRKILILTLIVLVIGLGWYIKSDIFPQKSDGYAEDVLHTKESEPINSGMVDLTNQGKVDVAIKDFEYDSKMIKIKRGTTVTWTNYDEIKHNAMRDHGDNHPHDHSAISTKLLKGFNGPLLAKGESWSFTFNENPGVVDYHCGPHPSMKGVIEIVE